MAEYAFRVDGLNRAIRAATKAGADSENMRELMHSIGEIVAGRGRALAPARSRHMRDSIRAGRGKTKAVVRTGFESKRLPYAGVVHYGWPARHIKPSNFMLKAIEQTRGEVITRLETGLGEILDRNNL